MFMHRNWRRSGLLEKMAEQAGRRSLKNLTIGPVLTWNNEKIKELTEKFIQEMESLKTKNQVLKTEKDKEEDSDFVSCKISGLEGEPPSDKNSLT